MLPGRTTAAQVLGVIRQSLGRSGDDITPFIDSANEMVTELCAGKVFPAQQETTGADGTPTYKPATGGFSYTDYRLELIERWLAAHFYAVFERAKSQEIAADTQATFQGRTSFGLLSTYWGQQACRLDSQGTLAIMDAGQEKFGAIPPAMLARMNLGVHWNGVRYRLPYGGYGCGHRRF